ncbi:sulfatase [Phenylobacterium sp. J367]|uniref:sulfatase family protein n=1 Tax=Phenylobacterium sp. J367 TaxID=2898435 RepID=UPI002150FC84|nr:sulfatase [Phenylobacterium sp. J367]MCR5881107.1 sulfatase [Phenylobacterium sp. J367]
MVQQLTPRRALSRRRLLGSGAAVAAATLAGPLAAAPRRKPNIVVILCDDLGYGDLGVFGSRLIRTPNIDRLAREGARLTDFYAAANVCTPSRAGLLTGRYPIRMGLAHEVIQAGDTSRGLPQSEVTIAEALRPEYATALVGKWHLGHVAPWWPPTSQGFDVFFGLPYSHDMKPIGLFTSGPGVELTREDVDMARLTERFFDRGLAFVEDQQAKPFLLMLALTAPHLPLVPHPDHKGHSPAAAYGDVVEEVDAGVGRLLAKLKALGLDRDTLVILTSDNGPWFDGSAGPLRDRKGGAGWDGGYRVPFVARYPAVIPAGLTSDAIAMNIDLLPTFLALAGQAPPAVELDGRDLTRVLTTRRAPSPHDELILFNNEQVAAIRTQRWKLVGRSYYRHLDLPLDRLGWTGLFDVQADPSESYNLAAAHPDVLADMKARMQRAQAKFEPMGVAKAAAAPAAR